MTRPQPQKGRRVPHSVRARVGKPAQDCHTEPGKRRSSIDTSFSVTKTLSNASSIVKLPLKSKKRSGTRGSPRRRRGRGGDVSARPRQLVGLPSRSTSMSSIGQVRCGGDPTDSVTGGRARPSASGTGSARVEAPRRSYGSSNASMVISPG